MIIVVAVDFINTTATTFFFSISSRVTSCSYSSSAPYLIIETRTGLIVSYSDKCKNLTDWNGGDPG
jgi:hypothetical protein